jgi:hypothetical protein
MPFALLIVGLILLVSAVRDSQDDLFTLVKGDFSGQGNFVFWVVSLLVIGGLGYIPKLKPISDGFLVLVLLVLFLTKGNPKQPGSGGFFEKFSAALKSTTATPAANTTATPAGFQPLTPLTPLGGLTSV